MSTAPRVLLTHAIVWSAIGAWLVGGSEVAGNIVLFVLWTLAVTGIAVVFVKPDSFTARPRWINNVAIASDFAIVITMAGIGRFVLASVLAIWFLAVAANRRRAEVAQRG